MNPLYNILGGRQMPQFTPGFLQAFDQFRQTFSGDPRQTVQNLLNSGRMTQDQFNHFQSIAAQMLQLIK